MTDDEEPRRSADEQNKIEAAVIAAIIVVVAMLIFPLIFAPEDAPWLRNVKEFQTLFAGILAILAAWLSVLQMRISDERSETRHRDLIGLQTRPDALRVERLGNVVYTLRKTYEALSAVHFDASKEQNIEVVQLEANAIAKLCPIFQYVLNDAAWEKCADLFGARLSASLAVVRRCCVQLEEAASASCICIPETGAVMLSQGRWYELTRVHRITSMELSGLMHELDKLQLLYRLP